MGEGNGIRSIAILIACHNRRDVTLECLSGLFAATRALEAVEVAVYLVDDGSSDGTAQAVKKTFPSVHVIDGDGTLYWAKGMRKAWEAAVTEKAGWDGYLWLNDDTELYEDAVARILATDNGDRIVVGELENARGDVVYGMRADGLFTGNCVYVPREVYGRLGMICGDYSHAWADSDYALLAKRARISVASAGVVGRAEGHPNRPSLKGLPLVERIKSLHNPKGWNLHDLWLYRRRNLGYCAAIASCAHLICHVVAGERR